MYLYVKLSGNTSHVHHEVGFLKHKKHHVIRRKTNSCFARHSGAGAPQSAHSWSVEKEKAQPKTYKKQTHGIHVWYIYLYVWLAWMVNFQRNKTYMDSMGYIPTIVIFAGRYIVQGPSFFLSICRIVWCVSFWTLGNHTIDGWNPAPVELGSLSQLFTRVLYISGGARFLNHQQHHRYKWSYGTRINGLSGVFFMVNFQP